MKRKYFVEIVIIILIFILSIVYYYNSDINYLSLGDPQHTLIFAPENEFKDFWYHWIEYNFGGGYALISTGRIIEALIFYILRRIFDPKFSFFIFIFSFISIGGYGFYVFAKNFIFNHYDEKVILSLIGASFYSTNLFVNITLAQNVNLLTAYILTPWIIYAFLRYIEKENLKHLIFGALLISLNGVNPNPPIIIISFLIIIWTILTYSIIQRVRIIKIFQIFCLISFISLLFSCWWIIPALTYYFNYPSDLSKTLVMEQFWSEKSTFLNVYYLSGYWELFRVQDFHKVFYFSEYIVQLKGYFIFISALMLIPLMTFIRKKNNRKNDILLFSCYILLVLSYLFSQGYNDSSIIRNSYIYLMKYSNFFSTFRNNYKFVAITAYVYSILLPYLYIYIKDLKKDNIYLSKIISPFSKILIIIIILSYSFPLWTLNIYNHYYTGIPSETFEVSNFLNKQLDKDYGKVMIMPGTWLSYYKWAYYFIQRPIFLSTIERRDTLIFRYGGEPPLSWTSKHLIDDILYKHFFNFSAATLSDLGIKYILFDKTLDSNIGGAMPSNSSLILKKKLRERFDIIYINKKYILYKIDDNNSSLFIIPKQVLYVNMSNEEMLDYIYKVRIKEMVLTNSHFDSVQQFEKKILTNNSSYLSYENIPQNIKYEKIDPTEYKLHISSEKPFMLVLLEGYDPQWAAYVNEREYKSIPLFSVINGFWINEIGDLTITVKYKPQQLFYYGFFISIISIICIAIFLLSKSHFQKR